MECKLFFAGDVVLANNCVEDVLLSNDLAKEVESCDIKCCNLEAPIKNEKLLPQKKIGPNNYNSEKSIKAIKQSGINLVTLANNHIFDFGIAGIYKTIDELDKYGIDHIGAGISHNSVYAPYIKICNGVRVGILNFAENGFGAAIENQAYGYAYVFSENVVKQIKKMRSECDLLVTVCHAGAEMWNVPLPEWRKTYKNLIDIGVNVVIAHHPHVPQGWEDYKKGVIFYSLGNFAFNKGEKVQNSRSISVILDWKDGIIKYKVLPTEFKDKKVFICYDPNYNKEIDSLCNILKNHNLYFREVDKMCLLTYEKIYKNAYSKVICRYKGNIVERLKGIIKKIIVKGGFQDIWLYHNITIETHYYICKRASALILKENGIL